MHVCIFKIHTKNLSANNYVYDFSMFGENYIYESEIESFVFVVGQVFLYVVSSLVSDIIAVFGNMKFCNNNVKISSYACSIPILGNCF
jgi:hypothetical protein